MKLRGWLHVLTWWLVASSVAAQEPPPALIRIQVTPGNSDLSAGFVEAGHRLQVFETTDVGLRQLTETELQIYLIRMGLANVSGRREAVPNAQSELIIEWKNRLRSIQQNLELRADRLISELGVDAGLTDEQVNKLRLAAGLDINQALLPLTQLDRTFANQMRLNASETRIIAGVFLTIEQKVFNGHYFGPDSFYGKVQAGLLTDAQIAKLEASQIAKRERETRKLIERAVAYLEAFTSLTDKQKQRLVELAFARPELSKTEGYHGYEKLKHIPRSELVQFLDDSQIAGIERCLKLY